MITSRQNRWLKDIRQLRRGQGDRALLEGPHLVGEALTEGLEPEVVLVTPQLLARSAGKALVRRLPRPPLVIEARLLASAIDSDSPRGLAAVVHLPRGGVEELPVRAGALWLFAHRLQDPGNLGALARVAEAAGASGLALSPGTAHPNHPRALRASAGSLLRLPTAVGVTASALDEHLRPARPTRIALVPRGGADLYEATVEGSLVLVVGGEGGGLPSDLAAASDLRLSVPLEPPVESLNLTAAAAVVLFELRRRRAGKRPR